MPPDRRPTPKLTSIWSHRFSVGRGWHVRRERDCAAEDADAWLRVFRDDEPAVAFAAARGRPPRFDTFRKLAAS